MAERPQISGSLFKRLTAILIFGSMLLSIVLFFVVREFAARIAQAGQDSILEASVSSIIDAAVIRDGRVEVDFPYASFSMLDTDQNDRVFYAIRQDGQLLSGYKVIPQTDRLRTDSAFFETRILAQSKFRIASAQRVLIGSQRSTTVSVYVAQTQDSLSQTLKQISLNVGALCLVFFTFTAILSYIAALATVRPLSRLASSVQRRSGEDLRPFKQPVPSEMVPLVSSLNSLMNRLDQTLTRSEDFIAEAAHRVRTPLATVRSYAETTLQRVTKSENRNALKAMMRAVDESSRAAGQLLDHAMITFRADHLDKQQVDLSGIVEDLATSLAPIAEMKDLKIVLRTDGPVHVEGDPILLQNAFRNVLDNALKYAPFETEVTIQVTDSPRPTVTISDLGAGFPNDEIQALTKRFRRGKNAKNSIGSGLGLTIAQDVALAHGGSVALTNGKSGGACVTFYL